MGAECIRDWLQCGDLARVTAAGPLNLSGPFWPPPLPYMGPPLLIHFSAQCLSSFPPSHPDVLNLGLLLSLAVLLSSMGVLCDLVFSLLLYTFCICSHASISRLYFLFALSKLLVCPQCSKNFSVFCPRTLLLFLVSFPPNSEDALGTCLVFFTSFAH